MNARIGYVFFLTTGLLSVLAMLLFHPVALSADAKPILESVLGALTAILMSAIHSVFQVNTQGLPAGPSALSPAAASAPEQGSAGPFSSTKE